MVISVDVGVLILVPVGFAFGVLILALIPIALILILVLLIVLVLVRKTLKLNSLFFFIYFRPVEPKHNSKHSQTNHGNNNSHTCNYSIVYVPVHVHPRSTIKYSKIYVT